jgi:hypothetical protein
MAIQVQGVTVVDNSRNITAGGGTITTGNIEATLLGGNTTTAITFAGSQTSGSLTIGGTSQTGTITIDRSTGSHTLNIGTGANASGVTKTINFGTGGAAGSTTNINIGTTNGGTVTIGSNIISSPGNLGNSLGNTVSYASFRGNNSNANYLDFLMLRKSAGTDWTTASTRIQQRIDATYMAFMEFNGTDANGGIEWGSGTTTTSPQAVPTRMRLDLNGSLRLITNVGSTSTTSGTLIVTGGVGVSENLYVGGTLNASNLAYTGTTTSSVSTISAAGTTQSTATLITTDLVIVSTVNANTGVRLPASSAGKRIVIRNSGTNDLRVYPATGAQINSLGSNVAFIEGSDTTLEFIGFNTTQWYTINATFA